MHIELKRLSFNLLRVELNVLRLDIVPTRSVGYAFLFLLQGEFIFAANDLFGFQYPKSGQCVLFKNEFHPSQRKALSYQSFYRVASCSAKSYLYINRYRSFSGAKSIWLVFIYVMRVGGACQAFGGIDAYERCGLVYIQGAGHNPLCPLDI